LISDIAEKAVTKGEGVNFEVRELFGARCNVAIGRVLLENAGLKSKVKGRREERTGEENARKKRKRNGEGQKQKELIKQSKRKREHQKHIQVFFHTLPAFFLS
jgi:hypothetical protein